MLIILFTHGYECINYGGHEGEGAGNRSIRYKSFWIYSFCKLSGLISFTPPRRTCYFYIVTCYIICNGAGGGAKRIDPSFPPYSKITCSLVHRWRDLAQVRLCLFDSLIDSVDSFTHSTCCLNQLFEHILCGKAQVRQLQQHLEMFQLMSLFQTKLFLKTKSNYEYPLPSPPPPPPQKKKINTLEKNDFATYFYSEKVSC